MRVTRLAVCLGLVGMVGVDGADGAGFDCGAYDDDAAPAPTQPSAAAKAEDAAAARKARMAEMLKDYHGPEYVRSEVMIPMRDGATLHTVICGRWGARRTGRRCRF